MVKRILILEGDPGIGSQEWRSLLMQAGYQATLGQCVSTVQFDDYDLLVLDAAPVVSENLRLREALNAAEPRPKVLFVARDFTAESVLRLSTLGDLSLPYPLEGRTLLDAVSQLFASQDHVQSFARAYRLSPREVALLKLAVLGRNNDEAAAELGCSRATVATYWNRMFRKTGVSGQRDLIVLLLRTKHGSGSFPRAGVSKPLTSRDRSGEK